jgi:hypothetical protein
LLYRQQGWRMAALRKAHVDGNFIFLNLPGRALKASTEKKGDAAMRASTHASNTAA